MNDSTAIRSHNWKRISQLIVSILSILVGPFWVAFGEMCSLPMALRTVAGMQLGVVLAITSYTDVQKLKIPNWVTYPSFVWAIVINGSVSMGFPKYALFGWFSEVTTEQLGAVGIADCLGGFGACFGLMLLNYLMTRKGAGDVKLAGVVGAWLGVKDGISSLLLGFIVAAATAFSLAIWRYGVLAVITHFFRMLLRRILGFFLRVSYPPQESWLTTPLPFAAALAGGTLIVLCFGNLFDRGVFG